MLSIPQIEVMELLNKYKKFIRYKGGFWSNENSELNENGNPVWNCGIDTLRALNKKGYVTLNEENQECILIKEFIQPTLNSEFLKEYPKLDSNIVIDIVNNLANKSVKFVKYKEINKHKTQNKRNYNAYGMNQLGKTINISNIQHRPHDSLDINFNNSDGWSRGIWFSYIEVSEKNLVLIEDDTINKIKKYYEFEFIK